MIKIIPNFFRVIFDGHNASLICLEDNAYITFSSEMDSNGVGIFVELNKNRLDFPVLESAAYAVALQRTMSLLKTPATEDQIFQIESDLNEMVLKNHSEFHAELKKLQTLFTGVVSNTTKLFTQELCH